MSITIYASLPSGPTYYGIAQNAAGAYWNGSAYVANPSPWSTAAIAVTSTGMRVSVSVPDDAVSAEIRQQAGGSPASTDIAVWTGESEILAAAIQTAIGNIVVPSYTGSGDIAVNHNTGGADAMRCMLGGQPQDNCTIRAYVASAYAAGTIDPTPPTTMSGSDGRWVTPLMLDADTYTFTVYNPVTKKTDVFEDIEVS